MKDNMAEVAKHTHKESMAVDNSAADQERKIVDIHMGMIDTQTHKDLQARLQSRFITTIALNLLILLLTSLKWLSIFSFSSITSGTRKPRRERISILWAERFPSSIDFKIDSPIRMVDAFLVE